MAYHQLFIVWSKTCHCSSGNPYDALIGPLGCSLLPTLHIYKCSSIFFYILSTCFVTWFCFGNLWSQSCWPPPRSWLDAGSSTSWRWESLNEVHRRLQDPEQTWFSKELDRCLRLECIQGARADCDWLEGQQRSSLIGGERNQLAVIVYLLPAVHMQLLTCHDYCP